MEKYHIENGFENINITDECLKILLQNEDINRTCTTLKPTISESIACIHLAIQYDYKYRLKDIISDNEVKIIKFLVDKYNLEEIRINTVAIHIKETNLRKGIAKSICAVENISLNDLLKNYDLLKECFIKYKKILNEFGYDDDIDDFKYLIRLLKIGLN